MQRKPFQIISVLLILSLFFSLSTQGQIGGTRGYNFLNMPNSARAVAMGGSFLSVKDGDITLAVSNPSTIDQQMHNQLAVSFVDYYAGINYGFASYSRTWDKLGSFVGTVQYISYGEEKETTIFGDSLGYFSSAENALVLSWARPLDSLFFIGANFKMFGSYLYDYISFGLGVDLAATYHNPAKHFTASLLFTNIGRQVYTNIPGRANVPLPFELQLGVMKGFQHVPLRFSFLLTNLQKLNLSYINPSSSNNKPDPFTGEIRGDKDNFAKKIFRHAVVGVEFAPVKSLSLRMGYNFRRQQEMKMDNRLGGVGFSWGVGVRVSRFQINYSRGSYHLVGSPNYITIAMDLGR